MHNLVVAVLGNPNSGKSFTWNQLFQSTVKTGTLLRQLWLSDTEYVDVFLVSGSPEERKLYVGDIIGPQHPTIVLCSMQYTQEVHATINYFLDNDYAAHVQWLNPGHSDGATQADTLGLMPYLLYHEATVAIRDATGNAAPRTQELMEFIRGWAHTRDLIQTA